MRAEDVQSGVWTTGLRIHSYDVDFKRRATLDALCRYFFDAAWNHAEALGVGYTHLAEQAKFWVLSRLAMKIQRAPQWGEQVTLNTWPREPRGIIALRDFELVDALGARIVGGVSGWLVLDAHSRRPQRLDKLQWALKQFPVQRATEQEPEKLAERVDGAECFSALVRYGDLDVNHHVNSASYIRWLMDAYTLEFHRKHAVQCLEVNYLGETTAGQQVSVLKSDGDTREFWQVILADGKVACRARLVWRDEEE
jgi:acyl-ACP thioesterase